MVQVRSRARRLPTVMKDVPASAVEDVEAVADAALPFVPLLHLRRDVSEASSLLGELTSPQLKLVGSCGHMGSTLLPRCSSGHLRALGRHGGELHRQMAVCPPPCDAWEAGSSFRTG